VNGAVRCADQREVVEGSDSVQRSAHSTGDATGSGGHEAVQGNAASTADGDDAVVAARRQLRCARPRHAAHDAGVCAVRFAEWNQQVAVAVVKNFHTTAA
jgi:hypothetical protein